MNDKAKIHLIHPLFQISPKRSGSPVNIDRDDFSDGVPEWGKKLSCLDGGEVLAADKVEFDGSEDSFLSTFVMRAAEDEVYVLSTTKRSRWAGVSC